MNKYVLMYNDAFLHYDGNEEVEIGKVIDTETEEDILYIIYNKHLFRKENVHTGVFKGEDEIGKYCVVKIDDLHRNDMITSPALFLTGMLHEYGHYKNGDLDKKGLTTEIVQSERTRLIKQGKVQEEELKADAFAISCVGKNTFMRWIDHMIKRRIERGGDMHLALQEFELRKKAARKLKI